MKFSIIIPAYKALFFEECIESVLNQIYSNFELIILNDNSPENIKQIVDNYTDNRIRYYENSNNVGALNIVDNWNHLLSLVEGDFVICMGDDDILLPNCLSDYKDLIEKYNDFDVFHGWTELIDENSKFYLFQERRPEIESVYSMIWHRMNGRLQYIGDFCFRTTSLRNLGGFYKLPLAWASDDITSYIIASGKGIINSQKLLFQYRVNSQTISSTGNVFVKLEAIDLEYNWMEQFLIKIPVDCNDKKYHWLIRNNLNSFFLKKRVLLIASDISNSLLKRGLFWLFNRNKYKFSLSMVMNSFVRAVALSRNNQSNK